MSENAFICQKGKICIPTFNGRNKIVFDEIIEETMSIGKRMLPGILIVSGDCTTMYKKTNKNEIKRKYSVFSFS